MAVLEVTLSKMRLADMLIEQPDFDGEDDARTLCEMFTEDELKEALAQYSDEYADESVRRTVSEYRSAGEAAHSQEADSSADVRVRKPKSDDDDADRQLSAAARARKKYDQANTRNVPLKLNIHTDADILEWLDRFPNKQGAIKEAIRKYIGE